MEITVLASGSKGNCTVIKTDAITLLIDAGISFKRIKGLLAVQGIDSLTLDAVLLTHEHIDHVKGLERVLKETPAMLYATTATFKHLQNKTTKVINPNKHQPIINGTPFMLGDLVITPMRVSHDAVDALGFVIQEGDKTLVYMTDLGYLPIEDYPAIMNADMYIFEANYDVSLLFSSSRPHYLKRRIDSVRGHMSNTDSAYHMCHLIGPRTKTIVLAHPSEECNTARHVLATYREVFQDYDRNLDDYEVIVAKQHEPIPTLVL